VAIGRAIAITCIIINATSLNKSTSHIQIMLISFVTLRTIETRLYMFLVKFCFWWSTMTVATGATPNHSPMTCQIAAGCIGSIEDAALSKFDLDQGEILRSHSRLVRMFVIEMTFSTGNRLQLLSFFPGEELT
jgi:hypothetical protein